MLWIYSISLKFEKAIVRFFFTIPQKEFACVDETFNLKPDFVWKSKVMLKLLQYPNLKVVGGSGACH